MNFVITPKMSYNYQINACTVGFCKKPQVPLVMGVVDTGLLENTCLPSKLMKKPQAPMPFYILHPVHHHILVEVQSVMELHSLTLVVFLMIGIQFHFH